MSASLLMGCGMAPDRPPCHNRGPASDGRWYRNGHCPRTLKVKLRWYPRWFEDPCATWDGVGIGQPTPEYPSGTPYPIAMGWIEWCKTCRWMPEGVL